MQAVLQLRVMLLLAAMMVCAATVGRSDAPTLRVATFVLPPYVMMEGSGANRLRDRAGRFVRPALFAISCRQHGIPDRRRTSALETQPAEIELSLVDSAQQFNAGNRDRCGLKPLKSQHWTDA